MTRTTHPERHRTERIGWFRAPVPGFVSATAGGANVLVGAWRVTFLGALAMTITAGAGALFGAAA